MPNVSSFGAQTDNAVVSGTVTDRQMIIPDIPPQGLMSVGPRVTPNFVKPREWNAQTTYHFFDAVRDAAGNAYVATKPVVPAGTPLTDEDYWFLWADPDTRFDDLNETVKTFNQRITQNTNDIATKAPENHASEVTIYGIGNEINYGHVRLAVDDTPVTSDANAGVAATPHMVAALIKKNKEFLTPEMFGAVGDGSTDDSAALNAMFQKATNKICILSKTYAVHKPLIVPDRVNIAGFSNYSIKQSAIVAKGTWEPNSALMTIGGHCGFFNVFVGGIQDPDVNMTGISYNGQSDDADMTMIDCCVYFCHKGMSISGRNYRFVNTLFSSCNYVCMINNAKNIELRDYEFINCRFHGNSIVCTTEGITAYMGNTLSINFIGCEFEFSAVIYKGVGDGVLFDSCKIVGKVRTTLTSDTTPIIITHIINQTRGLTIRNCDIDFYREGYDRKIKFAVANLAPNMPYLNISNNTIKDFDSNVVATIAPGKIDTLVLNGNVLKKSATPEGITVQRLNKSFTRAIATSNYIDSDQTEANALPIEDSINAVRANNLTNSA